MKKAKNKWEDPKKRKKVTSKFMLLTSLFGLDSWTYKWDWYKTSDSEDEKKNTTTVMNCSYNWKYKEAKFGFFPHFWELDNRGQSKVIIHELCHFLTDQQADVIDELLDDNLVTRREADRASEHDTSSIEMLIVRLLEYGSERFRKRLGMKKRY